MDPILILWIFLGLVLVSFIIIIIWYVTTNNMFNRMSVKIEESESAIDVALTKRYDLLSKMVSAVKGYTKHEEKTLANIVKLRQPENTATIDEKEEFSNQVTDGLTKLNIVVEQYPDLKASANFGKLQDASVEVEENLQAARRVYNSNVSIYNQKVVVFPSNLVAGWKNHSKRDFFEAENYKREDVDFNF